MNNNSMQRPIEIQYSSQFTESQNRDFFTATNQEQEPTYEDQDTDMQIEQHLKRKRPVNGSDDSLEEINEAEEENIQSQRKRKMINAGQNRMSAKPVWKPYDTTAPPINHTLASEGQGKVILIVPEAAKATELINDPIEVTEMMDQGIFGKMKIEDVRINKRKLMIAVHVEDPTEVLIEEILATKKLGKWNVTCKIPNSDMFKYGIISPVHPSSNLDKIKDMIKVRDVNCKIEKIERLQKKTQEGWVDSATLKVMFLSRKLPDELYIGHSYYKVRPYVAKPVQCYNCQRLGHTSMSCKAKIRCMIMMICGESHNRRECQNEPYCANCGGPHTAISKLCQRMQQAHQIEKVKAVG